MKKIFVFLALVSLLSIFGCAAGDGGDESTNSEKMVIIEGKAEKGPLQKGAVIEAARWDPSTGYSGEIFVATTTNNMGAYTLEGSISGILDVYADGFFINESTGIVSDNRIVISGLIDSSTGNGNINIVTHIIKPRVMALMRSGKTFDQANNQAIAELYSTLNWPPENPSTITIDKSSRLLFLSAAICQGRSVSQISDIITILANDMEDGSVNISILDNDFYNVNCAQVKSIVFSIYGLAPDLDVVKSEVIAFRGISGPSIIRIVDPAPVGNFYYFTDSHQLSYLHDGVLDIIQMKVTIKEDGKSDVVQNFNCIDFFKIDNITYFSANYDSTERFYSQENGVVSSIVLLPAKPAIERITPFDNGHFSAETIVYEGITCTDVKNITMASGISRNIMVSNYFYGMYSKTGLFFVVHDNESIIKESGLYFWSEDRKAIDSRTKEPGRMWK